MILVMPYRYGDGDAIHPRGPLSRQDLEQRLSGCTGWVFFFLGFSALLCAASLCAALLSPP